MKPESESAAVRSRRFRRDATPPDSPRERRPALLQFVPLLPLLLLLLGVGWMAHGAETNGPVPIEVKQASIDGKIDGDNARLTIQAVLGGAGPREPALYGARVHETVRVTRGRVLYTFDVKVDALRGALGEVSLVLGGDGDVTAVKGEGLEDWSVRRSVTGGRSLVLRVTPGSAEKPRTEFTFQAVAETPMPELGAAVAALTLVPVAATLGNGYVRLEIPAELDLQVTNAVGLVPIEPAFLPESLRAAGGSGAVRAYRFHGEAYTLPLRVTVGDPEAREVVVADFRLAGDLSGDAAVFLLTGTARVRDPKGGVLDVLSGAVALGEAVGGDGWRMVFENGRFRARFDRAGEFALRVPFHAAVRSKDGWNALDFQVAAGALAPLVIRGIGAETQLRLAEAARPERAGDVLSSFLPAGGRVNLEWRPARPEVEGKLFFAAEAVTQIAVSPGLMRQTTFLEFKVMQGELNRVDVRLDGDSHVEFVQGAQVLAWEVQPITGTAARRLVVRFNQPQRDVVQVNVQQSRQLGAFPLETDAVRVVPEGATRFAGYLRVVNAGAVRLEVLKASGLSQISPEQFVQSDAVKALLPPQATQVFAYRFASAEHELRLQADNILPELAVSEVLVHALGETETSIEGELEIDVREAPLRELLVRVPRGYSLARLNAPGIADQFLTEPADSTNAQLRVVYASPVIGRQVLQFRLERNQTLGDTRWVLPRVEVLKARSVRGHVGVVAEAGFRLTPGQTVGLTEVAPAFFPKKVPGLQAAFRLSDAAWQASFGVERLPQSIQADAFHLFSVGEGIAYGSSLVNYVVSGAPVSTLRVELSGEYFNVEFTGKNVRNWQKIDRGYQVQLHTPVSGTYSLLATYERPFKAQGETLAFTGVRPLDAQTEQGYSIIVSTYQFQVQPATVSGALVAIEPGEVPAEYRLFFDAPILAAYRYTARPYTLQLDLRPLAQGETVSQVIDRAALTTRISDEGQIVTEGRYFVKNKGTPFLRLRLPEGAELWSVTLDGATVVPVKDERGSLIPMPHRPDPDVVTELQVKIATKARNPRRLEVAAPILSAPLLLAEWRLQPAGGRRLVYRGGTLTPADGVPDASGFAGFARLLASDQRDKVLAGLGVAAIAVLACALAWSQLVRRGLSRFGLRHLVAGVLGGAAAVLAIITLASLCNAAKSADLDIPDSLRFVAPVQQGDVAWKVTVDNLPLEAPVASFGVGFLACLGIGLWGAAMIARRAWWHRPALALAWTVLVWASLRAVNGAGSFFAVLLAFVVLHVLLPGLRRWWQVPAVARAAAGGPPAGAVVILIALGCWLGPGGSRASAATGGTTNLNDAARTAVGLESVTHEIRVEDEFVFGQAHILWEARKGQTLALFHEPGVLTRSGHPTNRVRLVSVPRAGKREQVLVAEADGRVEFELQYQTRVGTRDGARGFELPVAPGLAHRARVTVRGLEVDIGSPQAIAVRPESTGETNQTVASLVLAPSSPTWITWRARSRDVRREKSVFYAEWVQLFVPGPGAIEGVHDVQVRPAQGEVTELAFAVPAGTTITDVTSPALGFWRFDPDAHRLRVVLAQPQSKPFAVQVKSQIATTPLPFTRAAGLVSVDGAAGQTGLAGVATGAEVQLDDVQAEGLAALNLEDFPGDSVAALLAQYPGLALRRAYRYATTDRPLTLRASPVEPDVRVDSQQTLSLGEDRSVLAATLNVEVTRAGIFKLSFVLPTGLDVESISGAVLSHWTEVKTGDTRVVTLHLKGRTTGTQAFTLTLTGPGVRSTRNWAVPRLVLREASKQRGQLLVVPEQGLRLQVAKREGATQLDPLQAGVRQKNVLAFRLLQDAWALELDLERVDAWIQVTSLQHVVFGEAQIKVVANLQYDIENTGVKTLTVRLPAAAENVRFKGEQVTDFVPRPPDAGTATRDYDVKLERRVLGRYLLSATYTLPLAERATNAVVDGVQAQDVNLQRGFVSLQTGGRLQVRIDTPAGLQATEWQAIPRALLQDLTAPSASYTFRLVEPGFKLPVALERRETARLLPARVSEVTLTSVISDDGALLTQARLRLVPGDKRLLHLTLPAGSRFWFAFVNQNSVWPWQSTNQILLPLEQSSRTGEPTTVEFFYSGSAGRADPRTLNLRLLAPKFDLPLENITWNVHLNEKWKVQHWDGSLQLREDQPIPATPVLDLDSYVRNEAQIRQEKTKEAEQFLSLANTLLQQGDPLQARRAFRMAYGMSQHDQAFNEDARVQLNNLKVQQALVGLNVRQARVGGENQAQAATPRSVWDNATANYSQSEAKQLLERNTAEDSAVQQRLAERLIQQQDAAVANPAAIRATVPEQGRRLTFTRPLEVNTWTELHLGLRAVAGEGSWWRRLGVLALVFVSLLVLSFAVRRPAEPRA